MIARDWLIIGKTYIINNLLRKCVHFVSNSTIKIPFCKLQVLLTPPDEGPRVKGLRIKLQDIVDGEYMPLRVNGTWIGGKINSPFLYFTMKHILLGKMGIYKNLIKCMLY